MKKQAKLMEFSNFEIKTIEALDDCKGAVKNCSKHAIEHLKKAWLLCDTDNEMAVFRAITAEEEASSALFFCLKNNQYENSNKLEFKNHVYKLGVFPFIKSIGSFMSEFLRQENFLFKNFSIRHTSQSKRKAIELILHLKNDMEATPIPPLNFSVKSEDTGKLHSFEKDFQKIIEGSNFKEALEYIKKIANQRNELLYADQSGIPKITSNVKECIILQKNKVMLILTILLMIDPWEKEHKNSLFVQQSLNSFLLLLNKIKEEEIVLL